MSENSQENTIPARPVKFKSNAPWVLGLIALMLAIPNLMCQMLCKDAVSTLDKVTADVKEVSSSIDKVASSIDKVAKNDAKALRGLADTIDAASKGDLSKVADAGKKTLDASVDTMRATADVLDDASKQADKSAGGVNKRDAKSESPKKGNSQDMKDFDKDFDSFMEGSFFLCLGMFILSLFGKSKLSAITGLLIVAGSLGLAGWSFLYLQVLGCIEGALFLFSGIFSITNRKKAK